MYWCYAIVNNRLAEIYFNKNRKRQPKIWGHCYIGKKEYQTKEEQKWIDQDTKKVKVRFRNKKYQFIPL